MSNSEYELSIDAPVALEPDRTEAVAAVLADFGVRGSLDAEDRLRVTLLSATAPAFGAVTHAYGHFVHDLEAIIDSGPPFVHRNNEIEPRNIRTKGILYVGGLQPEFMAEREEALEGHLNRWENLFIQPRIYLGFVKLANGNGQSPRRDMAQILEGAGAKRGRSADLEEIFEGLDMQPESPKKRVFPRREFGKALRKVLPEYVPLGRPSVRLDQASGSADK